jgi:hypothetical protein
MTYIRVCREIFFDTGKYDYKLWSIIFLIIIALQILAGPFYGPGKYWYVNFKFYTFLNFFYFLIIIIIFL